MALNWPKFVASAFSMFTFLGVHVLVFDPDPGSASAFMPFRIQGIQNQSEREKNYTRFTWKILAIFHSTNFEQK